MEAMACGCQIFSSVNGALADYLDPGFNCQNVGVYSTAYDVDRILKTLQQPSQLSVNAEFFDAYREAKVISRLREILISVNYFFDHVQQHPADIPGLSRRRLARLRLQSVIKKVQKKLRDR